MSLNSQRRLLAAAALIVLSFGAVGCGSVATTQLELVSRAPVTIPGIDDCDDFERAAVPIDPTRPVVVLVHGCLSSSSRLAMLEHLFEAVDQQTVCFTYNYRDRPSRSAAELREALVALRGHLAGEVTLVGHSQGGLVARDALAVHDDAAAPSPELGPVKLVTVSSPFNGIAASSHCGLTWLHILSLGITTLVCQGITGRSWREIHPRSTFMRAPRELSLPVTEHVRIATDERDTCRTSNADGSCREDDFVFSLEEQQHPDIDRDGRVAQVVIEAGHAEVIGLPGRPPFRLVETLQRHGVMAEPSAIQAARLRTLMARLYR